MGAKAIAVSLAALSGVLVGVLLKMGHETRSESKVVAEERRDMAARSEPDLDTRDTDPVRPTFHAVLTANKHTQFALAGRYLHSATKEEVQTSRKRGSLR